MFVRSELKSQAKSVMKKNYFIMVLVCVVSLVLSASMLSIAYDIDNEVAVVTLFQMTSFYVDYNKALMMAIPSTIIGILWMLFVNGPGSVGIACFFQRCSYDEHKFSDVWSGFKENYGIKIKAMALVWVKVLLWSLLFVIPGYVKSLSYAFVPYLLNDYPEKEAKEILEMSEKMAKGMRFDMFILSMSFILWIFAAACGDLYLSGFCSLLLMPYINQTNAQLYHWAKANRMTWYNEGEEVYHD